MGDCARATASFFTAWKISNGAPSSANGPMRNPCNSVGGFRSSPRSSAGMSLRSALAVTAAMRTA